MVIANSLDCRDQSGCKIGVRFVVIGLLSDGLVLEWLLTQWLLSEWLLREWLLSEWLSEWLTGCSAVKDSDKITLFVDTSYQCSTKPS